MDDWGSFARAGFWSRVDALLIIASGDDKAFDELRSLLESVVPKIPAAEAGQSPLATSRRATSRDKSFLERFVAGGAYELAMTEMNAGLGDAHFPGPDIGHAGDVTIADLQRHEVESRHGGDLKKFQLLQLRHAASCLEEVELGGQPIEAHRQSTCRQFCHWFCAW